ncbi:MAG: hypothetical protein OEZ23_04265, partial [Gammaproteobacteria bacterium]|nr:hypothetical protein [Gammaproteobacteria bacterium]
TVDAVMTAARVWHNRKAVVGRALKTLSYDRFLQLQQQLALLDGMAKGQASGNVWDELANIFLLLGGAPVITGTRFN